MVALIAALAKILPAVAELVGAAMNAYYKWRIERNEAQRKVKDARNDALIDAAGRMRDATKAINPVDGSGQHQDPPKSP